VARAILRAVINPSGEHATGFILETSVLEDSDYITNMVSRALKVHLYYNDYESGWDRYCNRVFKAAPRYMGRLITEDSQSPRDFRIKK
jgi:hypothetical protein